MDPLELIIDYHIDNERQGPGSEEATIKALGYISNLNENTKILDIGCGTGGQTITLARNTEAKITAVDILPQFLEKLKHTVSEYDLTVRVETKEMLMDKLVFDINFFDVIWSEGAIYNIGFEKGLCLWRKYLKENGYIALSEITWLTCTRPEEIERYWVDQYPEIDTTENKLSVIRKCGYDPVAHFTLDDKCWTDNYYKPLMDKAEAFLEKYDHSKEVKAIIEEYKIESRMYDSFKEYYSYVFYIAKKYTF